MNKTHVALDHLNLTVRDFSESADWYKRVFGFLLVEEGMDKDGPWGILRSGDFMLCIYESPSRSPLDEKDRRLFHQIYHFGLRVKDQRAWEETLNSEKLRTYYRSPVEYPYSLSWYIKDPTGYMIEVALWNDDQVSFNS